jgi:hypothetical protein
MARKAIENEVQIEFADHTDIEFAWAGHLILLPQL